MIDGSWDTIFFWWKTPNGRVKLKTVVTCFRGVQIKVTSAKYVVAVDWLTLNTQACAAHPIYAIQGKSIAWLVNSKLNFTRYDLSCEI